MSSLEAVCLHKVYLRRCHFLVMFFIQILQNVRSRVYWRKCYFIVMNLIQIFQTMRFWEIEWLWLLPVYMDSILMTRGRFKKFSSKYKGHISAFYFSFVYQILKCNMFMSAEVKVFIPIFSWQSCRTFSSSTHWSYEWLASWDELTLIT